MVFRTRRLRAVIAILLAVSAVPHAGPGKPVVRKSTQSARRRDCGHSGHRPARIAGIRRLAQILQEVGVMTVLAGLAVRHVRARRCPRMLGRAVPARAPPAAGAPAARARDRNRDAGPRAAPPLPAGLGVPAGLSRARLRPAHASRPDEQLLVLWASQIRDGKRKMTVATDGSASPGTGRASTATELARLPRLPLALALRAV